MINTLEQISDKKYIITFLHMALFSPEKSTWLKAIKIFIFRIAGDKCYGCCKESHQHGSYFEKTFRPKKERIQTPKCNDTIWKCSYVSTAIKQKWQRIHRIFDSWNYWNSLYGFNRKISGNISVRTYTYNGRISLRLKLIFIQTSWE